jgi:ribonuclease HII
VTESTQDARQGMQRLYATLAKRFEKDREERVSLDAMRHFEKVLWRSGIRDIAGADDSKRLDAPTRARLAVEIRARASGVAVGIATVEDIDRVNIYHASLLAMRRAVESLPRPPQHVLVDARTVPGIAMPQNAFNKGDGINLTIAAASITRAIPRPTTARRCSSSAAHACTACRSRCCTSGSGSIHRGSMR